MAFLRGEDTRVASHQEYMNVYQVIIYQCDTNDNNNQIHEIFESFVQEYLDTEVLPMTQGKVGETLIKNLVDSWDRYTIYSKMMDRSFEYLNRYYLKNNQLQLIGEKCLAMFKENIFNDAKDRITGAILSQISLQREGNAVQREYLKKAIQVYVDMGLVKPKPMRTPQGVFLWQGDRSLSCYDDYFEQKFLANTQQEAR